nr:hypothetical protein BaRGS_026288 [Batillaria attramentaria]
MCTLAWPYPPFSIAGRLQRWADIDPDAPAFVFVYPTLKRFVLSRTHLLRLSSCCATKLDLMGIKKGDVVCNTLPNSPERLLTDLGIMLVGAKVLDGAECLDSPEDFLGLLKESGCKALLYDPNRPRGVQVLLGKEALAAHENGHGFPDFPQLKVVMECRLTRDDKNKALLEVLEDGSLPPYTSGVEPDDVVCVWTAHGKADGVRRLVPRTQKRLFNLAAGITHFLTVRPQDVYYNDQPLASLWGFIGVYLNCGATRVMADFSRGAPPNSTTFFYDVICKQQCTVAFLSESQLRRLTILMLRAMVSKSGGQTGEKLPLGETERSNVPVQQTPLTTKQEWMLRLLGFEVCSWKNFNLTALRSTANVLVTAYGSPEAGLISWRQVDINYRFQHYVVGPPAPGVQVKIVHHTGLPVMKSQTDLGEILVKSDMTFEGYLKGDSSDKSEYEKGDVITEDGWVKTGDVGHASSKRILFVYCRKERGIPRGFHIIYPGWLESHLSHLPAIRDVAIVPVHNELKDEPEQCACVWLDRPVVKKEQLRQALSLFCNRRCKMPDGLVTMAPPEHFLFLESFPFTRNGEVCRKSLEALAFQSFGKQSSDSKSSDSKSSDSKSSDSKSSGEAK